MPRPSQDSIKLQLWIPRELKARLEAAAVATGQPMADIIRQALREWLERQK